MPFVQDAITGADLRTHFTRGAWGWKPPQPHIPTGFLQHARPWTGCHRKRGLPQHSSCPGETWGCGGKDSVFSSNPAEPFLACSMLGQPINGKRCEKRSPSHKGGVGRPGELWVGKQEGKARKLGPKRDTQNQGCVWTTGPSMKYTYLGPLGL